MAQRNLVVRFSQRLSTDQFDRLEEASNNLKVPKAEITRTALDRYLNELASLRHKSKTPAA
ncbi:ribbon-helix-helix domain-containing protein [Coleofasciculus sp. FACHB-712]|nr:ribbon-helix-helix domain-containing protein [Coleofasciculus sp. FACHB-712]